MKVVASSLSKRFIRQASTSNFFYAVEKLDFILPEKSLIAVTGRSGSGKSTLLNMLAGLLTPTEGKVILGDVDLYAVSDAERSKLRNAHVGVIPQGQTGLNALTILENVLLPLDMYGNRTDEKVEFARLLLEKTGIAHLENVFPNELSGGELRRMAIARALVTNPPVILADEPTGDLDDENVKVVLNLLRDCADEGAAVLLVTHEKQALSYADKVFRMDGGILSEYDTNI